MKNLKYLSLSLLLFISMGCEKLVEGINDNPNEISSDSFEAGVLLLKGIELANISVQAGHQTRIAGMWCGQTRGLILLYKSLSEYNISAEETNGMWQNAYQGVVKQARLLRQQTATNPKAKQYSGITKVLEANALGTLASMFGDIPYTEISNEAIADPKFDGQKFVFAQLQILLDEAIADLGASTNSLVTEDLMLAGNTVRWTKVARTLKARFYIHTKEYDKAYQEALVGVLTPLDALVFTPPAIGNGSQNLNFKMINQRGGYWGFTGSYLDVLLGTKRNNIKTQENARLAYYRFDGASATNNKGIAAINTPITLIGYEENTLILAESAVRTGKTAIGLTQLNNLRAYLAGGKAFIKLNAGDALKYEPYVLADFEKNGIENKEGLVTERALLREIIEERYVSGFAGLLGFDDLRRLGIKEKDIAVLPPFNSPTISQYPQRFIVAQSELSANENAPKDAGIFALTEVNK
jgi:hypothetical protein